MRVDLRAVSDIDFLVDFEADYKLRDHIRLSQALERQLGRGRSPVITQRIAPIYPRGSTGLVTLTRIQPTVPFLTCSAE